MSPTGSRPVAAALAEANRRAAGAGRTLRLWSGLANGELSVDDLKREFASRRELVYLTIDPTPSCDLTCRGMCYYHDAIDRRRTPVDIERLHAAIDDAA